METWIQNNKLEWIRWSWHQKLYCFNKYVKYYQLNPMAAQLWQCVRVCVYMHTYHSENTVIENVCRCLCSIFSFTCKKFPRNSRGILWKRPPPMYQPEAKDFLFLKPHVPPLCLPRNTPFLNHVLIFHFGIQDCQ